MTNKSLIIKLKTPGFAFKIIEGSTSESQHEISRIYGFYYSDNS